MLGENSIRKFMKNYESTTTAIAIPTHDRVSLHQQGQILLPNGIFLGSGCLEASLDFFALLLSLLVLATI